MKYKELKDPICPECKSKDIRIEEYAWQYIYRAWNYNDSTKSLEVIDVDGTDDEKHDPTMEFTCNNCGYEDTFKYNSEILN